MIRKLIPIVLLAGLTACASTGRQTPADSSASSSYTPGAESSSATSSSSTSTSTGSAFSRRQTCDAQPVQGMIGKKLTPSVTEDARVGATSKKTRILRPGEVMTMEYDPERLNLILDNNGALTALRCG